MKDGLGVGGLISRNVAGGRPNTPSTTFVEEMAQWICGTGLTPTSHVYRSAQCVGADARRNVMHLYRPPRSRIRTSIPPWSIHSDISGPCASLGLLFGYRSWRVMINAE